MTTTEQADKEKDVIALYECTTREQQQEYEWCANTEAINAIEMSGGDADPRDYFDCNHHIADLCENMDSAPAGISTEQFKAAIKRLIYAAIERTEVKYDQTGADEYFNTVRNKANESL